MTGGRFSDTHVFRAHVFSLGIDTHTGGYFLSTPLAGHTHAAEYEAYFAIDAEEYRRYADDPAAAADLLEDCRQRRNDERRLFPPPNPPAHSVHAR